MFLPELHASAQQPAGFPVKLDQEGFRAVIVRSGKFFISGQPEESSFSWLKEQGVTTVVNLRTQPEMDNRESVPFDEAEVVKAAGMEYIHIPLGGDDLPYTPEALEKFVRAAENAGGKVLLHCTVGWRASHMWAAYLVRQKKLDIMDAITQAQAINFGTLPLEGFLGEKLVISVSPD